MRMAVHQRWDRGQEEPDTTYTKIFVGGLAWETSRDAMRRHFEQYGEILEAVVIADKITGRSKGYGFVTFKDPEAARRACADPTPIIDGRRANCNLASIGARPRSPFSFFQGNRLRFMSPYAVAASLQYGGSMYMVPPAFLQHGNYTMHYGYPYPTYGYPYMPELLYQQGLYNVYGGLPYPQLYSGPATGVPNSPSSYPYAPFMQQGSQGFSVQLPQAAPQVSGPMTSVPQQSYALLPLPSPGASAGPAFSGVSSGTGPFQQVFIAHQQPFPQVQKPDNLSS
ncbi:hypothetical protein KP509_23G019900 [Ceratopteris richardii]|uniref:RRM domain-containing protein n=1 Tax=Ceratopteris richardii TaxID=49495 RepID=A0A8T2S086_CERRI|nr:hypothetical protein KP509_23G019900 [Ceratopteris richardii]